MQKIIKELGLNSILNKPAPKQRVFNSIKNNTPLMPNMNDMADILHISETKEGFKYLLVMVDLASDKFDIEPLKKLNSTVVLEAMEKIFKRPYVKKPFASIRMDNGPEFKGAVKEWLYNNNIVARYAMPYRHKQLSSVENLNGQLGYIFNLYMNEIEQKTGKVYKEWTDILDFVRVELNKARAKKYTADEIAKQPMPSVQQLEIDKPLYKVGDLVHYQLSYPKNALNEKQPTSAWRKGDFYFSLDPVKIIKIVQMNDKPYNRYILDGMKNVSFSQSELKPELKKEIEPKFKIYKIWDMKLVRKQVFYLVQFSRQKKDNSQWISAKELIDKGYEKDLENAL
ncbi:MAG: transposase family protein [Gammaproteobacteria bacterium]|nr:transposase family protein [Gammaproteobacteria bacterium]